MKTSAKHLAIALASVLTLGSVRAAEPVAPTTTTAPADMEGFNQLKVGDACSLLLNYLSLVTERGVQTSVSIETS